MNPTIQQTNMTTPLMHQTLVEKAMQRREARLAKATLNEVEQLEKMEKTGIMSPYEAEALKSLAIASFQIDTNKIPRAIPQNYPQQQTKSSFNAQA